MKRVICVLCLLIMSVWIVNTALVRIAEADIFDEVMAEEFSGRFFATTQDEEYTASIELILKKDGENYIGKLLLKGPSAEMEGTVSGKKFGVTLKGTVSGKGESHEFTFKKNALGYLFETDGVTVQMVKIEFPDLREEWKGTNIKLQAENNVGNHYTGHLEIRGEKMSFDGIMKDDILTGEITLSDGKKREFSLEPEGKYLLFKTGAFEDELKSEIEHYQGESQSTKKQGNNNSEKNSVETKKTLKSDTKNFSLSLPGNVNMDMLWVNPGTFMMGSPTNELGRFNDEIQHQVTLTKGFWLGKYEVTQAQYETIMGNNPTEYKEDNLPVGSVTWSDATNFCAKLTEIEKAAGRLPEGYEYTLPTEAQWEYACRAGTTTVLNNGKNLTSKDGECPNLDEVGWYDENSGGETHPVGEKKPNAWGFYDMHGNVWELCLDWYGDYPTGAVIDPTGSSVGSRRVIRGGSLSNRAYRCRSAFRHLDYPNRGSFSYGFRVALSTEKQFTYQQRKTTSTKQQEKKKEEGNIKIETKQESDTKNFSLSLSGNVNIDMLWVNPGTFMMGSPTSELGRDDDEIQHQVKLTKGFWLGKFPVTQAQYEAVMGKNPASDVMDKYNLDVGVGDNYPVYDVSWYDAMSFCAKLTEIEKAAGRLPEGYKYTLPTEAQWEYACRAGTKGAYNVDDCSLDSLGWYGEGIDGKTHPVGQKKPNVWGFYDMHGNVWEWCLDWYDKNYYNDPCAGIDPKGPDEGSNRVVRGGSWINDADFCRSADRNYYDPNDGNSCHGFRVALSPEGVSSSMEKRPTVQLNSSLSKKSLDLDGQLKGLEYKDIINNPILNGMYLQSQWDTMLQNYMNQMTNNPDFYMYNMYMNSPIIPNYMNNFSSPTYKPFQHTLKCYRCGTEWAAGTMLSCPKCSAPKY